MAGGPKHQLFLPVPTCDQRGDDQAQSQLANDAAYKSQGGCFKEKEANARAQEQPSTDGPIALLNFLVHFTQ